MLFNVILGKYNDYFRLNGGTVEDAGFNGTAKPANIYYISKNTPLIKLLSLEDQCQNDWLYIVLVDIVSILVIALYISEV